MMATVGLLVYLIGNTAAFIPSIIESIKVTNCMAPNEEDDWYCFLPEYISPRKYKDWWLVDRFWTTLIE
jgi:hypothetical protein